MLKPNIYVPILKWKRAEQTALKNLSESDKKSISPLIELVMPKPKSLFHDKERKIRKSDDELFNEVVSKFNMETLPKITDDIFKVWEFRTAYVDLTLLYPAKLKIQAIKKIHSEASETDLHLIPVVNLNDNEEYIECATDISKKYKTGFCLRIVTSNLASIDEFDEVIDRFLIKFDLDITNIDLLVDVKEIVDDSSKYSKYFQLIQQSAHIKKWRGFIFAGGAFPEDMTKCRIDDENRIPRIEWLNWSRFISDSKLKRKPNFADYTIQYPIYNESFQFFPPTSSIKYTLNNVWYIMKGKKNEHNLYLANAKLLSNEPGIFFGEKFSFGDKYIAEKGRHYDAYIKKPSLKGTGTPETWLLAGINHHMVCTIKQIASLLS